MRVDVDGYNLHCTLTHGLGDSSSTWAKQIDQLSRYYQVLTWDLRAHGKSDSPVGEWTINDLSGDLRRLLTVLEIPSTHLLGHSAGGAISTHFTLQYPHQVQSLTLVGSASEANEKAAKNYERLARKAEQEGGSHIFHRNIPGSRLEVVKDRGHALYREDPEEFNQPVLNFVRGVQK